MSHFNTSTLIILTFCYVTASFGGIRGFGGWNAFSSDKNAKNDATANPIKSPTNNPIIIDPESICFNELEWKSYNNQIYLNGNKFNIKGLSWSGFETQNFELFGLNIHTTNWYLNWMVDNGFNALRLPFSQRFMNPISNQNAYKAVVEAAGQLGILVVPDFHSKTTNPAKHGFNRLNKAKAINVWQKVAILLKHEYNVFIADLFNEPHDVKTEQWDEWIQFCEDIAYAIWSKDVNWLVAMQGTNTDCLIPTCSRGENLQDIRNTGIRFNVTQFGDNRFIYSPHVEFQRDYSNIAWNSHWGYLVNDSDIMNDAAIVIGEFGTDHTG
eukprot:218263_1